MNSAVAKLVYAGKDSAQAMVIDAKEEFDLWATSAVEATEEKAKACFETKANPSNDDEDCIAILDSLAVATTKEATARWTTLWQTLMTTYVDGMVAVADDSNLLCGCSKTAVEFEDSWRTKVIEDTGPTRYLLPSCPDDEYVDPDGHCQPLSGEGIAKNPRSRGSGPRTIRKEIVPGVAG